MAVRAFSYLLRPTVKQSHALAALLGAQRELYNAALEERRGAWAWERRHVSRFEQFGELKHLHDTRPDLMRFGVCAARGTLTRLDRAFRGFFARARAGEAPGFPRFRGAGRFASVEYPDRSGWRLDEDAKRLHLRGVGHVKLRLHRPLRGEARTCTLKREGRRWRVTVFAVGVPEKRLAPTGKAVGIDLGVERLVTTSEGEAVDNPRWLRVSLERLAGAQRLVASRRRGSKRRRRAGEAVGRLHRKVRNQRRDLHHKLSRRLVDAYDVIVHEDLKITNMTRRPAPRPDHEGGHDRNGAAAKAGLNREILAAGWGQLLSMIAYKAEEAGRQVVAVDPRHTSQTCHRCGHVDARNRAGAVFRCLECGHHDHADVNAAHNILRAGLARRHEREAGNAA